MDPLSSGLMCRDRSLPSAAAGLPRAAPKRSGSAAFQPIVGFSAARQRSRSAEVARPGMQLGSAASSGLQQVLLCGAAAHC